MCTKAGTKPTAKTLTAENIYTEILTASQALDDALVPDTQRVLVVSPAVYRLIKQCKEITMETEIGNDMRLKGVVSNLDGRERYSRSICPTSGEFRLPARSSLCDCGADKTKRFRNAHKSARHFRYAG